MQKKNILVTFDGPDLAGKTTLIKSVKDELHKAGIESLIDSPFSIGVPCLKDIFTSDAIQDEVARTAFALTFFQEKTRMLKEFADNNERVVVLMDRWLASFYAYNINNLPQRPATLAPHRLPFIKLATEIEREVMSLFGYINIIVTAKEETLQERYKYRIGNNYLDEVNAKLSSKLTHDMELWDKTVIKIHTDKSEEHYAAQIKHICSDIIKKNESLKW